MSQVAYLLVYGELPDARELSRWDEALMRHSAVPDAVERAVAALPHDAHFMGIVLTALNALSTVHPEQNPALAGQNIYKSKEIQDKQIVRLIGEQLLEKDSIIFVVYRVLGLVLHDRILIMWPLKRLLCRCNHTN